MLFKIKTYPHTVEDTCVYHPWEVEAKESGVQGTSDTLGIQNQSWLHETLSKKIQNQPNNHSPH